MYDRVMVLCRCCPWSQQRAWEFEAKEDELEFSDSWVISDDIGELVHDSSVQGHWRREGPREVKIRRKVKNQRRTLA
jgi:hypothetical protein